MANEPPNFYDRPSRPIVTRDGPWIEEPPLVESEADYEINGYANGHETQEPPVVTTISPTPLGTRDLSAIPPRRWLYGHELIRGFVTILASPGGVGKTAYTVPVALSVALGRPLLDQQAKVHVQGSVWLYNLEDPLVELDRRLAAALKAHGIEQSQVNSRVYTDSGREKPLCIATRDRYGDLKVWPNTKDLIDAIKIRGIVLLVVDPFIHSHEGKENDNGEMAKMIAEWGKVADGADCAVWLVHHFRKGGSGSDPDSIRGAVAIVGAVRSAWTVSTMSTDEAKALNVPEDDRGYYFRHDNAKQNMAPPLAKARWHELLNIKLDNGTEEYPDGDFVQAVKAWEPPDVWKEHSSVDLNTALDQIAKGPEPGVLYTASRRGGAVRWAGQVLVRTMDITEGQAAQMIGTWVKNGLLVEGLFEHPKTRKEVSGVRVVDALRPS